jgi:hypothetical protein
MSFALKVMDHVGVGCCNLPETTAEGLKFRRTVSHHRPATSFHKFDELAQPERRVGRDIVTEPAQVIAPTIGRSAGSIVF